MRDGTLFSIYVQQVYDGIFFVYLARANATTTKTRFGRRRRQRLRYVYWKCVCIYVHTPTHKLYSTLLNNHTTTTQAVCALYTLCNVLGHKPPDLSVLCHSTTVSRTRTADTNTLTHRHSPLITVINRVPPHRAKRAYLRARAVRCSSATTTTTLRFAAMRCGGVPCGAASAHSVDHYKWGK